MFAWLELLVIIIILTVIILYMIVIIIIFIVIIIISERVKSNSSADVWESSCDLSQKFKSQFFLLSLSFIKSSDLQYSPIVGNHHHNIQLLEYVIPPPPPAPAAVSPKSPWLTHYPTANALSNG